MENNERYLTKKDLEEAFDKFSRDILMPAFDGLYGKFDDIDDKFDKIDKRFEALEYRLGCLEADMKAGFSDVNSELFAIKQELKEVKVGLARLEKRTKEDSDAQGRDILRLEEKSKKMDLRVTALEVKINK